MNRPRVFSNGAEFLTGLKFFIVYIFCYRHAFGVREELRESVEIKQASSEKSRHILEHKIKDEREIKIKSTISQCCINGVIADYKRRASRR